jgi:hypothetical protein
MDDDSKDFSEDPARSGPSSVDGTPTGSQAEGLAWCSKCDALVKPEGKGRCPKCQTFTSNNFANRKHPINVKRVELLEKALIADYQPDTTSLRASCKVLAGVLERLEVVKANGSMEHTRLVEEKTKLTNELEESNRRRQLDTATREPLSIIREFIDVVDGRIVEFEPNRESRIEHLSRLLREELAREAGLPSEEVVTPAGEAATPTPAPAPSCPYCGVACVGKEHPSYSVLHWRDPQEVARRDAQATDEMTAGIARQYGRDALPLFTRKLGGKPTW